MMKLPPACMGVKEKPNGFLAGGDGERQHGGKRITATHLKVTSVSLFCTRAA